MQAARWVAVALGFAIPLSVALDNLLLAILLIAMLLGGGRAVLHTLVHNPVARASGLLFAALSLGVAYGAAPLKDAVDALGKYADLAFVPLLMVAGRDAMVRRRAMLAFLAVMTVTALLSWLVGLGMLPVAKWMWAHCTSDNPAIFRGSITQNILMAYASFLLLLQARQTTLPIRRWLFAALALLAGSSVLFMVRGKTGYFVLLALLIYFAWKTLRRSVGFREVSLAALLGLILVAGTYQMSPRLHERVNGAVEEFQAWKPNVRDDTSTGSRMEFYYNTLGLIKQHPLSGVGTGGFPAAYAQQVQGKDVRLTNNPHNEYLLVIAQIGAAGLVLLLYLFFTQWRYAARLPGKFEQDAARGLVLAMAVASLFNSPLYDHTEGLFYAYASALLFANLNPNASDA